MFSASDVIIFILTATTVVLVVSLLLMVFIATRKRWRWQVRAILLLPFVGGYTLLGVLAYHKEILFVFVIAMLMALLPLMILIVTHERWRWQARAVLILLLATGIGLPAYRLYVMESKEETAQARPYNPNNRAEYLAKLAEAKAYYKDKCENVAGIRIYKTVPDVEGILLLKVRPERGNRQLADPMWPGAAFGRDSPGDWYIISFLGDEYRAGGSPHRGYITTDKRPGALPGYRWVEVVDPKDGQRYRYSGSVKVTDQKDPTAYNVQVQLKKNPDYDMNVYRWTLDKTLSPSATLPRYAVTFEDHVIPEERSLWVASSTVKVLDLETDEVLGELTRYAISYIHTPVQSMPWLNHSICPNQNMTGDSYSTRLFVDQVLLPKKEK